MKYTYILLSIFFFLAITANAQKFTLTPNGYCDAVDTTKDYVVITIPASNTEGNFAKAKEFVVSKYISPKDVLSETSNMLSINAITDIKFSDNPADFVTMAYTVVVAFKEDRMKIDFHIISMKNGGGAMVTLTPPDRGKFYVYYIFDKNNKIRNQMIVDKLNEIPNKFIDDCYQYICKTDEW